jgi:PHD/YefM family antitoxin component YafN of YafNO toxin-antitoxin module
MSRQADDWETYLKVAAAVAWVLLQAAGALKKRRSPEGPVPTPDGPAELDAAGVAQFRAALEEAITRFGRQARETAGRAEKLVAALESAAGPVAVLRRAAREHVCQPAAELADTLDALLIDARAAQGAAALRSIDDRGAELRAHEAVTVLELRQRVLAHAATSRTDPQQAALVGDADAIADDLLAPLRRFAAEQQGQRLRERPICVPSSARDESVWLGLLPGYPVVVVPDDLGGDWGRWGSLPHEIGHVVFEQYPAYAREAEHVLGLGAPPRAPVLAAEGEGVEFSLDQLWTAWFGEMQADAFAAVLLGPAALRSFVACFAHPESPESVITATAEGPWLRPHPPAHLRILWMVWLLERMAFEREPRELLAAWTRLHGEPDRIIFPVVPRGRVDAPLEAIFEAGVVLLETWYAHPWACFDGHALADIPGLEMTPGAWGRVRRNAPLLTRGTTVRDAPRYVLAAAMEAFGLTPASATLISKAAQASIRGLEADAPAVVGGVQVEATPRRPPSPLADLQAALVLREVLAPRRRGTRIGLTGRSVRPRC